MIKTKVVLVRCDTYEDNRVYKAVSDGIDLLDGISQFARPAERIVMKPNVLLGTNFEKCVTTHLILYSKLWVA